MSTHNEEPERLKILIIDDDPVDRAIFRQSLDVARPGMFLYREAGMAREGLSLLEDFQPDCILLDFHLPDLDGFQMLRHFQRPLPCAIVMMTGTGSEQIAVEAMKLGVMDYLAKGPESSQVLLRTVASAVQRFRLQQQIENQRHALAQRNRELEAIRAELFEEKERYRTLAEAIPQLVWAADSEGRIDYANQRLAEFTARPNDPSGGGSWLLANLVHAEDRGLLAQLWSEAVRSGGPFEAELRLQRFQDGAWRRHLMRTVPMRAGEEGPVRWFGTFTDIEDQRRAEEATRQRQKLESIGLLAGGIAHDFNNLLVGIMGGASFALDSLDSDHPAYPMLEIVSRSSERAAHLTRQLLAYSGKAQAFPEPVEISGVARRAAEQLRNSIPKAVALTIETSHDIPPIQADANQMEQLIVNLVMNAAEAIEPGAGIIKIRTAVESLGGDNRNTSVPGEPLPSGRYVVIEVSDSGCGLDREMQARIFDPFFTTKFTGRGLGLAAVQGIVRTLAGGIQVKSQPGEGSTFRVLLPLNTDVDEKRVVLLIGIEAKDASSFRRAGCEVLGCADAARGVEAIAERRGRIDLVVLDADRRDWQETLVRLRQLTHRVPVALLTANPEETSARAFSGPGPTPHTVEIVRKTSGPRGIEQLVERIFGREKGQSVPAVRAEEGCNGAST